jgi:Phosphomannomutase
MMDNIFGTDGIRGVFGAELNCGSAYLLGAALCGADGDSPVVVVGRDTRPSGEELMRALAKGVHDNGGYVINIGILPTNAVAYFTRKMGCDFGVMISASHNPPEYNGLKVFDRYGVKLCEKKQREISAFMEDREVSDAEGAEVCAFDSAGKLYCDYIENLIMPDLKGLKISLDCCYGSCYDVASSVFAKTGAALHVYCGFNRGELINKDCGATHTEFLEKMMRSNGCELGFAFDGDCDRVAVLERGRTLDNDRLLFALAKYMSENGMLRKDMVVGTVLTNRGVEMALNGLNLRLLRSDVGDANVFHLMSKKGVNLGGERSGHFLLSDFATGSDALLNALFFAKIYREKGSLFDYTAGYKNVPCREKSINVTPQQLKSMKNSSYFEKVAGEVRALFGGVKLVLRASGTEPKVRIYIEGEDAGEIEEAMRHTAWQISDFV